MKEITLKKMEQSVYYEKLENGLEVFLVPYESKKNYYMTYATKYGSLVTEFTPVGEKKMKKVPYGIAHFLEHKMFEQPDGMDPFSFFNQSGTMSNAMTSFDSTQYLCAGTKNLKENLDYLLNFVSTPYFTDENVEKEKGIITEEIKMYDDMPEWVMERALRESVLKEHPMRIDIAGKVEDITKITKEDLYDCYHAFYQPANMFLIVAGPQDVKETLKVVKQRVGNLTSCKTVKTKSYHEPLAVSKKEQTIPMPVEIPKVGITFKFDRHKFCVADKYLQDLYLQMFATLMFGSTSLFREKARKEQWMSSFYTEMNDTASYRLFTMVAETKDPERYLEEVEKVIQEVEITKEDFERMKKVWIASEYKMIDVVETTVLNLYDDIMNYGHIIDDKISIIQSLSKKELDRFVKTLDFTNRSVVKIVPKA